MELETPPPFMEKNILNFHFDCLHPSLSCNSWALRNKDKEFGP